MSEQPSYPQPGMPRWVKISGIIAIVLVVLVVIIVLVSGGEHGPGRHLPGGETPAVETPGATARLWNTDHDPKAT